MRIETTKEDSKILCVILFVCIPLRFAEIQWNQSSCFEKQEACPNLDSFDGLSKMNTGSKPGHSVFLLFTLFSDIILETDCLQKSFMSESSLLCLELYLYHLFNLVSILRDNPINVMNEREQKRGTKKKKEAEASL